ncbi:MAG: hypothetical protein JW928_03900 [Candidatus Aureabacteria bacterium]|nr:hypothetical protein [Candidatus Auribacterota bacterium]
MRAKVQIICVFLLFFAVHAGFPGSLEDIRNKLNVKSHDDGADPVSGISEGTRLKIVLAKIKELTGFVWEGSLTDHKYTNRVYACDVVLKIKKKEKGEKTYCPEILKVYLYDKHNNLMTVLQRYMVHTGVKHIEYYRDFQVNRTYHLYFLTDFETYKNAKSLVVVIGTPGEEIVAKAEGREKMEKLSFEEKSYLNLTP